MQLDVPKQHPEEEIKAGIARLREYGYKITKKRKEILEIFAHNQRYVNAQFIHNQLSEKYPTMSYNTTYRNIYEFVEAGILEATEYNQEQHFRINCLEHHHHHHHFICTNCGMAIPLDICPMDLTKIQQALANVEIESHRFEIFGKCAACKLLLNE